MHMYICIYKWVGWDLWVENTSINRFPVGPAGPRLPGHKIDTFLKAFNEKSMVFRSPAAPDPTRRAFFINITRGGLDCDVCGLDCDSGVFSWGPWGGARFFHEYYPSLFVPSNLLIVNDCISLPNSAYCAYDTHSDTGLGGLLCSIFPRASLEAILFIEVHLADQIPATDFTTTCNCEPLPQTLVGVPKRILVSATPIFLAIAVGTHPPPSPRCLSCSLNNSVRWRLPTAPLNGTRCVIKSQSSTRQQPFLPEVVGSFNHGSTTMQMCRKQVPNMITRAHVLLEIAIIYFTNQTLPVIDVVSLQERHHLFTLR